MPLVRIDLTAGKPAAYARTIADAVYDAMRQTLNVPENDRFQIITEHPAEHFIVDPTYLGIARSADCVIISITLNQGRSLEQKRAFYKMVADELHERIALRREDVVIGLVEVSKENWSFGNGEAQYA
jgi:4-oxalocrotonate tautomerase